jgi:hypothetical protein
MILSVLPPPPPPANSQSSEVQPKSLYDAVNACIDVHLSCPVLSEDCRKARDEDPKRSNSDSDLWQACIDSPPCSEKKVVFLKAKAACINFEIDHNKARKSCMEAKLACPPKAKGGCPAAKLVCNKTFREYPATKLLCPYSGNDCPAVTKLPCDKSDSTHAKSKKVCAADTTTKACRKAKIVFYDSQVQCLESHKSCIESELNGTTHP